MFRPSVRSVPGQESGRSRHAEVRGREQRSSGCGPEELSTLREADGVVASGELGVRCDGRADLLDLVVDVAEVAVLGVWESWEIGA